MSEDKDDSSEKNFTPPRDVPDYFVRQNGQTSPHNPTDNRDSNSHPPEEREAEKPPAKE